MKNQPKTPISNRGFNAQFLCIAPLSNPLKLDRVITSIDAVRIKYTYPRTICNPETFERFDTLDYLMGRLTSIPLWMTGKFDMNTYESRFKMGNYMYTVNYTCPGDSSFAVLVGRYNTADKSVGQAFDPVRRVTYDVVMDFNPNKVPAAAWTSIADILAPLALSTSVVRFDLAMDFPMARADLQLVQRPGSGYQCFVDPDEVKTEYTGKRSQHGAIKLYDKAADLGHPELNVTRCEITIDPKKFKSIKDLFPTIKALTPVELSLDFSSLPFPVQSVILHPDLYDLLKQSVHPNTWRKYKAMIQDYGQTYYSPADEQFKEIDRYVRTRLQALKDAGTVHYTPETTADPVPEWVKNCEMMNQAGLVPALA